MKKLKSSGSIKLKLHLPNNFQEKLTASELKYESGERTSFLIKEIISLYQVQIKTKIRSVQNTIYQLKILRFHRFSNKNTKNYSQNLTL